MTVSGRTMMRDSRHPVHIRDNQTQNRWSLALIVGRFWFRFRTASCCRKARFSRAAKGLETLFHLIWSPVYPWDDGWELVAPEQTRSAARCRPLDDSPGSSHAQALIEIHSHHSMAASFSSTDDQDETGFRLYGVIGRLSDAPEIRLRVGVYGYHWEIPASWALELPEGLIDCNETGEASEK